IAFVFGEQIAPTVFVVDAETEEFAEVVRNIGCETAPFQAGIEQSIRLIPADPCVFSAVKLPLVKNGIASRLTCPRLQPFDGAGHFNRFGGFWVGAPSKHQLAAEDVRLPFSQAQGLPTIHEIHTMKIGRCYLVSGGMIVA